jgi:hypothetical protein
MKINKIIIISTEGFSRKLFRQYGIAYFTQKNIIVEYWDIGAIVYPDRTSAEKLNHSIVKKISCKFDLIKSLAHLETDTFVINHVLYNAKSYFLYRTFAKYKIKYALSAVCGTPSIPDLEREDKFLLDWFVRKFKGHFFERLVEYILNKIPACLLMVRPADIVLAGAKKSIRRYPVNASTNIMYHHYWDYDDYIMAKKSTKRRSSERTVVFLDVNFVFHEDYQYIGGKCYADASIYFQQLRNFFDEIERSFDCKVVIAAHPNSMYKPEEEKKYFGGRLVVKNQTVSLVQESLFVISHHSLSISYAVLFHKPIIFITTNSFDRHYVLKMSLKRLVKFFGKNVINLDSEDNCNIKKELEIKEYLYQKYIDDYLKFPGTEDIYYWERFLKQLNGG